MGYGTKSRERNLNYIGIHSSEGRREDESSSDENNGKRENYDLEMNVNLFTVKKTIQNNLRRRYKITMTI